MSDALPSTVLATVHRIQELAFPFGFSRVYAEREEEQLYAIWLVHEALPNDFKVMIYHEATTDGIREYTATSIVANILGYALYDISQENLDHGKADLN